MLDYLRTFCGSLIDLSPRTELIGGLMIGLALAMACSGLCLLVQKKTVNPYSLLCGLIFAVNVASLAIGVGYSRSQIRRGVSPAVRSAVSAARAQGHHGPPMPHRFGHSWLREADANRDGQLTTEEAAQFVSKADTTGKGEIDISHLEHEWRVRGGPPSVAKNPPGTDSTRPERGRD